MTERPANPLVRGLLDRDAIEEDRSDVEEATDLLVQLRCGDELPHGDAPEDVEVLGSDSVGEGARQDQPAGGTAPNGTRSCRTRDDPDPA